MIYCEECEKYDIKVFLGFLNIVIEKYPTGKIVMISDNTRIHHSKLIQSFLKEMEKRLVLMFLTRYSSEHNLIEEIWGWMRCNIINNKFFSSIGIVKITIYKFIDEINKVADITIDRLCIKM